MLRMLGNRFYYPRRKRRGFGKAGCDVEPHMYNHPPVEFVKNRRNSLACKEVTLQIDCTETVDALSLDSYHVLCNPNTSRNSWEVGE